MTEFKQINYGIGGKLITESLKEYTRKTVLGEFASLNEFLARWNAAEQKQAILEELAERGEYYTPRAVTQFMVHMVEPRLGETVLDPASGTGGFVTCAIEHVRRKCVKTPADEQALQQSIHGVEKKPLPHLLCTTVALGGEGK